METGKKIKNRAPLLTIAMISGAALAYEILLMRLMAIIQWHHFAYMIISLALLGYGVSGTWLTLTRAWHEQRFAPSLVGYSVAFGVTASGSFLLAQSLPFNALAVFWDARQLLWLGGAYLLLFVPFFCAANCVCLCFLAFPSRLHRVYGADLLGAGAGAIVVVVLLFVVTPSRALGMVSAAGLLTAAIAALELRWRRSLLVLLAIPAALGMLNFNPPLTVSQFKGLSQALSVIGARQIDQRASPLAQLTTVDSPTVPFRHAPGLSLAAPGEPPPQLAVFSDADSMAVIDRFDGDLEKMRFLDYLTSALPYHLLQKPRVLLLGAGAGSAVLQASLHGAPSIDAVELNPQMTELTSRTFMEFSGAPYRLAGVVTHHREARGFVARHRGPWDLVQVSTMDSFGAATAGLHALSENYVYTVEAFGGYLARLAPGGMLAVTRWVRLPPRDTLKAFATAIEALRRTGVENPADHLLLIRGWRTSTLLVGQQPFGPKDIVSARSFARERWFDMVHYPGITAAEANRYNRLDEPWFFDAAQRLLGKDSDAFLDDYKFHIRPATDDRPHYFHFLKLKTLPEILSLRDRGGLPLLEQGYPVLVATLLQAVIVSIVLILLPLLVLKRAKKSMRPGHGRVLLYFSAIGAGFMSIEIAYIQKFILFLSHPLYAIVVVLSAFLVFAGLGSAVSGRLRRTYAMPWVTAGIVLIALIYLAFLPAAFRWLMPLPDLARIAVAVLLIAPLAFLMGIPFPLGLARTQEDLVPWAWGINGCASVASAVFATWLAVHAGFSIVVLVALVMYGAAAVVDRVWQVGHSAYT